MSGSKLVVNTSPYCKVPGCLATGDYSGGLCFACYQSAARLVKQGKITWGMLREAGKIDAPKTDHPQRKVIGRIAWFLGATLVVLAIGGCITPRGITVKTPPNACITSVGAMGAEPPSCDIVQAYYKAAQRCVAAHVDQRAMNVPMSGVTIARVPADAQDGAGIPYIITYDGNGSKLEVYGYFTLTVMGPLIEYNYPLTLVHEFGHYLGYALGLPEGVYGVMGHGTDNDPLKNVNCQEYLK